MSDTDPVQKTPSKSQRKRQEIAQRLRRNRNNRFAPIDPRPGLERKIDAPLPLPPDVTENPQALVEHALRLSLDNGVCIDTRFFAYSRKKRSGALCAPRAVYASSWILGMKLHSYFGPLLGQGFGGDTMIAHVPLDSPFPESFKHTLDSYDYDSDSDLEDDEDEGEDEEDGGVRMSSALGSSATGKGTASKSLQGDRSPSNPEVFSGAALGRGQTLLMRNCAYLTWKALVFYIYTGKISFAPLLSQQTTPSSDEQPPTVPSCSPKSMYRLADELGLEDLKKKALDDIQSKLSPSNILQELFSMVTSIYSDIRDMEIAYACEHAKTAIHKDVAGFIDKLDGEGLKRSASVISHLMAALIVPTPETVGDSPKSRCTLCNGGDIYLYCITCKKYYT